MSLNDTINELLSSLEGLSQDSQRVADAKAGINAVKVAFEESGEVAAKASNMFTNAFAQLAEGATASGDPLTALRGAVTTLGKDLELIADTASVIAGLFPMVGGAMADSIKVGAAAVHTGMEAILIVTEKTQKTMEGFDQASSAIRELDRNFGGLGVRLGMSFEEAKKFSREYAKMMSSTRPEFFMHPEEIRAVTQEYLKQSVAMQDLTEKINTTIGPMQKQEATMLLMRASGEHVSETTKTISDGMLKLGMTFEAATEQYGMIRKVSEETGLAFKDVKSALTGAVSGFEQLGVNMGFAQPVFEGFVTSLERVGLGIKQATELTRSFVSSLLGVADSYEKSFILAQKGGLDFGGGGGVFGASIGMQAKLLEAEETGDQSAVGLEMAKAMKEALASFTGGEIVTVKEAAASPELQNIFVMQQQILQEMFGVQGNKAATRTLELLQGIDDATSMGNEDVRNKLGELMGEENNRAAETLDEAEKSNRLLASISAKMTIGNSLSQLTADLYRANAGAVGETQRDLLNLISEATALELEAAGGDPDVQARFSEVQNKIAEKQKELAEAINEFGGAPGTPEGGGSGGDGGGGVEKKQIVLEFSLKSDHLEVISAVSDSADISLLHGQGH